MTTGKSSDQTSTTITVTFRLTKLSLHDYVHTIVFEINAFLLSTDDTLQPRRKIHLLRTGMNRQVSPVPEKSTHKKRSKYCSMPFQPVPTTVQRVASQQKETGQKILTAHIHTLQPKGSSSEWD